MSRLDPRVNPVLKGHRWAEDLLIKAVKSGRMHHAWLLTGPKGIGKATLAHRFSRWILFGRAASASKEGLFDVESSRDDGLWTDPSDPLFQRISSGGHADLITLQRELEESGKRLRTEIVAGDVRKVGSFLSMTAAEGGWRVVVIDGAEDMNHHAANALLKTLEEPPPKTVILLVSHAPGRLMATIKSRCRKLVLGPLGDDTVTSLLQDYLPDSDAEELKLLAAMGEGSIGRALNLRDAGGIALYGEMLELISTLPKTDTARLHGMVDAIARSRSEFGAYAEFDVFSELMGWWIARLVRAKATGVTPRELAPGEGALIARLSSVGSLDQWVEVWEKITRLFVRTTNVNLDRKQVLLNAFFALSRVGS